MPPSGAPPLPELPGETAAHRATRLAPVGAHRLRADSRVIHTADRYQVVTPSDPTGALNEVLWMDLSGPETAIDAELDAVFATYAALGIPFKWCVWPWSRPDDLSARLHARGTRSWQARGMSIPCPPPAAGAPAVRPVASEDELAAFARVSAAGWGEPLALVQRDAAAWLRSGTTRLYVAWQGEEPAGVAAARLLDDGAAYLMGAVVLPAHRGRGLYRALVHGRLADLAARGTRLAVTHAREATSAPILERLGFTTELRYVVHQHSPSAPPG